MYPDLGFARDEIIELCALVHAAAEIGEVTWLPIFGLFKSVVVTLTYLRRNRVQAEIAEGFGVSSRRLPSRLRGPEDAGRPVHGSGS